MNSVSRSRQFRHQARIRTASKPEAAVFVRFPRTQFVLWLHPRPTGENSPSAAGFPHHKKIKRVDLEASIPSLDRKAGGNGAQGAKEQGEAERGVLDQALLDFIRSSIRSVWALELLLLLRRKSEPSTVDELVRELRASPSLVTTTLASLEAARLTAWEGEDRYRYAPATSELESLCARLEAAWAKTPIGVTKAIVSNPNEKLQTFADAFRWKGDKE